MANEWSHSAEMVKLDSVSGRAFAILQFVDNTYEIAISTMKTFENKLYFFMGISCLSFHIRRNYMLLEFASNVTPEI